MSFRLTPARASWDNCAASKVRFTRGVSRVCCGRRCSITRLHITSGPIPSTELICSIYDTLAFRCVNVASSDVKATSHSCGTHSAGRQVSLALRMSVIIIIRGSRYASFDVTRAKGPGTYFVCSALDTLSLSRVAWTSIQ